MDLEFLKNAEKVATFDIAMKYFESLKYKKEIQHLFNKYFFPKFNLDQTIDSVDKIKLNNLISKLKSENFAKFEKLHKYNLKGIGPGEITLYFLVNKSILGGGLSSSVDLIVGSKKYEVKAVQISKENIAYDFKLGGNVVLTDILKELSQLAASNGMASKTEIKKTSIDVLRQKYPEEFKFIEEKFVDRAYQYFKNHEVIFINNSKTQKLGNIEAVKMIKKEEIMIERVTGGTIKPMVKL